MQRERPEFFRPALMAGVVAGLLSIIPFISYGCCLWVIGAAAFSVVLLSRRTPVALKPGDGALVGAMTGIIAAIVETIIMAPILRNPDVIGRAAEILSKYGAGQPPIAIGSTAWIVLTLFFLSAVYAVLGILGGIIGISLFAKKTLPPGVVPPGPAVPPPPPSGPGNAS